MRLYIGVVESQKRKGRCVKLAVYAGSRKAASAMILSRYRKWTLQTLSYAPGAHCIAFLDEFPN